MQHAYREKDYALVKYLQHFRPILQSNFLYSILVTETIAHLIPLFSDLDLINLLRLASEKGLLTTEGVAASEEYNEELLREEIVATNVEELYEQCGALLHA